MRQFLCSSEAKNFVVNNTTIPKEKQPNFF